MLYGRLVHVGETFNNLQNLGTIWALHKNAFGGRAPPGPAGEQQRSTDPLAVIRGDGWKGKGRVGN